MKKNGRFESYKHVMLFYANFLLDEDDDDDDREWTKKRLMKHHYVYFDKCRNSFYERERCSLRGKKFFFLFFLIPMLFKTFQKKN